MRLLRNIKRNPANAASLKMAHFSNVGVIEVFLEATPTTFITSSLLFTASSYDFYGSQFPVQRYASGNNTGLVRFLIGGYHAASDGWTEIIFLMGFFASILSSTLGISR